MGENIDHAFIRRAVEACDLAALRVALYQATGDPALAEFGPVIALDEADRARLSERAIHLLETRRDDFERRVPSDKATESLPCPEPKTPATKPRWPLTHAPSRNRLRRVRPGSRRLLGVLGTGALRRPALATKGG